MTLPEGVVVLNGEIERLAISGDFSSLEKLSFVRQQIINHTCTKKRSKK